MEFTVQEIAKSLEAEFFGDPKIKITSIAEPSLASEHDIALAIHPKYLDDLNGTSAECALLTKGVDWSQYGLRAAILVSRPKFAMSTLSAMVDRGQHYNPGIHPSAIIDQAHKLERTFLLMQ